MFSLLPLSTVIDLRIHLHCVLQRKCIVECVHMNKGQRVSTCKAATFIDKGIKLINELSLSVVIKLQSS
jgi:hypothetical protein